MLAASLIVKKRDGRELDDEEIWFLVDGYCDGTVADYQMSALAMAICLRGMTQRETATLTAAMLASGDRLPRGHQSGESSGDRPRVDKHSTGGLGDKVSLVLAPLLATCGVDVPMISGRGLGLSGGTLDKLEAIPGFRTDLSADESAAVLSDVGACIVSASENIAPADRRLYSLRDVTGTVESVPLITASILSKKLAANLDALVMDVKVGDAAFMKTIDDARQLASSIVAVAGLSDLPTTAILSDMDQPLGQAVGNALEVNEAIEVLQGGGPSQVRELTIELCADLLAHAGMAQDGSAARRALNEMLDGGDAWERFQEMVAAQGGRLNGPLKTAKPHPVCATEAGHVAEIDCNMIGEAVVAMGGGRRRMGDVIDPSVGVSVHVQIGDHVEKGQPLLTMFCDRYDSHRELGELEHCVDLAQEKCASRPLIIERISAP